jgi:hypothetical protein
VGKALDTEKLKKENSIILNVRDLDALEIPDQTRTAIKQALNNQLSIDRLKPKINIPILLLHECELTGKARELTPDYLKSLEAYHKERARSYFQKQVTTLKDILCAWRPDTSGQQRVKTSPSHNTLRVLGVLHGSNYRDPAE